MGAFEIWWIVLLFVTAAAVHLMAHNAGRPRVLGGVLALFKALNTAVLAYLGNTSLTGTVMAGAFTVIALGVCSLGSVASQGRGLFDGPR